MNVLNLVRIFLHCLWSLEMKEVVSRRKGIVERIMNESPMKEVNLTNEIVGRIMRVLQIY